MIKKIALLMTIALLSIGGVNAQKSVTLGHVNSQEIIALMPDVKKMNDTLKVVQDKWEAELLRLKEEYFKKIKEFQESQAKMPESIKEAKQAELQGMEERINTFNQQYSTDMQKTQQKLVAPILEKVQKAISEVGKENNYTYIFDLSTMSIVYKSDTSNDVTPLVKKKLGLK